MKLAATLAASFFSVVVMTAVLGAFAVHGLGRINESAEDVATNWLPAVKNLGQLRNHANQIRRAEADLLLSVDRKEMETIEAGLAERAKAFSESLATVVRAVNTDEEKAAFETFNQQRLAYFKAQAALLTLLRSDDDSAHATTLFRGESRTAFNGMTGALAALVDLNAKGADAAQAEAHATYAAARLTILGIVLGAVLTAIFIATLTTRSIVRQLGGEPAEASGVAQSVAQGDLGVPIALNPGDTTSLMAQLKCMQASLGEVVAGVRGNADNVATASAQIAQGNMDLSQRTEEQASSLQQTAASMEQLGSTVRQNAENAKRANQLALGASEVATKGGIVVGQVVHTMNDINDSSKKIAGIVGVIDGIAFQTNILALNAAVEAARAGEHGRGFAVVASEVRSLAGRSAEAAREIKTLIGASVERIERGTELVDHAGATMTEIVDAIKSATDIMGEISVASAEQSTGVSQIGEAVAQMDQVTQQNAALVEESAAAAESLRLQAEALVRTVAVFKLAPAASRVGAS